jgi:exopolyphosphatase/guanosine-5'-triphosphate,3'-diphosphate pyrophosphatase
VTLAEDRDDRPAGLSDLEPISVVDIGSNSVRLVVYEGAIRSPAPLFNEKVLCGLGRTVASTGRLDAQSVERAIEALVRFHAINRVLGVKNVRVIATAAVREAANGPEFIARAEQAIAARIAVLSGAREAELAASGTLMGIPTADGFAGDLGGGSLELIDIAGAKSTAAATLPLGGLRLIDTSGNKLERAIEIVDASLAELPWLSAGEGRTFYAVGGTWRSLAKLHMDLRKYPLRVMHGYSMESRACIDFCEDIRKAKKLGDIRGIEEVARARREVLPYGALVLERVLRRMKPKEVVFSVYGVREGLVFSLLSPAERERDPLLAFCEDHARLHSRSFTHAGELCAWTDALFTEPGPRETPEELRLRHAACLISDVGWRAHPDHRGEQSLNTVAHAGLGGIDHEGRIFLALTVYFRHVGTGRVSGAEDELPAALRSLVSRRTLKRARILGAAIRSAHMLSIGRPGIIDETPLGYEGGKLVLTLPATHRALDGERLRRRFEVLAELVDQKPEIRYA